MSDTESASAAVDGMTALTFVVNDQIYATDAEEVAEITVICPITPVPGCAPWVRGVMNLRGRVVAVMDVRNRLGMPPAERADTCIVITEVDDLTVGLIVDEVRDVVTLDKSKLDAPPESAQVEGSIFKALHRSGDEVTVVLNLRALLQVEDDEENLFDEN